jgi:hypothetical protein
MRQIGGGDAPLRDRFDDELFVGFDVHDDFLGLD